MTEEKQTQLAVVGAGPGGYAAAFLAADLGMQVSLIDPQANPGGVCLHRGCIPSKALLHVAHLIGEAQEAEKWGVTFGKPTVDLERLRSWKDGIIRTLTEGLGQLSTKRKIDYYEGNAKFIDSHALNIISPDGKSKALNFESAIVATGSRPINVQTLALESPRMMNSTDALKIEDIPATLLVVGGGYIGLELGSAYAALGSQVTVVEMMPGILPGVDRDLARILKKKLDRQFESILTETKVVEAEEAEGGIRMVFEDKSGQTTKKTFEKVMVSVGRKPNSDLVGLENTAVQVDADGFIKTDGQKRTAEASIYAIGDVAGQPMLAHKASHEARVAVEAIAGENASFEPRAIPAVVFTDPEIAWCGLTETEAKAEKRTVEIARFPWAASGRALTQDAVEGFTKLIIDPSTEQILGVGIVGRGAGELIAEGVLAIEMGAIATDVKMVIHPHPTLSETIMEAAEVFFGQSTHVYRPKRKKK